MNYINSKQHLLKGDDLDTMCPQCEAKIAMDDKFCGSCGKEINTQDFIHPHDDVFTELRPTLLYYFITLLLLSCYKLTEIFPEGIEGLLIVSVIDITIVVAFWGYLFHDLKSLFTLSSVRLKIIMVTIGCSLAGALLVGFLADAIEVTIYEDVYYSPYHFEDTPYPLAWAIIITCIQPAIFEEVAFRGFMFSNLQKVTSSIGVVYITAFLFGIIHLSFISLLWLVPIGLIFAMLRVKYNTLWYGIVGHFTYNFTITLIEFWKV